MERKVTIAVIFATAVAVVIIGASAWMMLPDMKEFEVDGIIYKTAYDRAVVNGYDDRDDNLVIPSEVEYDGKTYTVAAIADEAFSGCLFLTVSIPDTVRYIGECAFQDTRISSVHIPGSMECIGDKAFYGCSALTSADLDGVKTIGKEAFNSCTSLTEVSFGDDLISIGENAFLGCSHLGSMTFGCVDEPYIGENAFVLGDDQNIVSCTVWSDLEPGFLDDSSGFVEFTYMAL
ncbi:MAG: leucine-rich repeat domain-containing protein [Candidatus Methanomethylophilaceae archaeon]